MIGVLVLSHGTLAESLVNAAAMIMGRVPVLRAVGLKTEQSLDDYAADIERAWTELEQEGATEVLVLVDMFGGSCSNVALRLVKEKSAARYAVVTGANLTMVLEAAIDRDLYQLPVLTRKIIEGGRKSIVDIGALLDAKIR